MAINPNVTQFPTTAVPHSLPKMGRPLARKMAEVLAEVTRVPKNGRNDFHNYDYVTEGDLVDHIRDKLAEKGVAIFPSVRAHNVEEMEDARKRKVYLTTVTLDVTLIDGQSGDMMTTTWIGQGLDNADKGYYKAYTGAIKYFLLKTFLISTGDDPEIDDVSGPVHPRNYQPNTPSAPAAPAKSRWQERVDELNALLEASVEEETKSAFCELYVSFMDAKSLEEIDAQKIGAMCRKLRSMTPEGRGKYIQGVLAENADKNKSEEE